MVDVATWFYPFEAVAPDDKMRLNRIGAPGGGYWALSGGTEGAVREAVMPAQVPQGRQESPQLVRRGGFQSACPLPVVDSWPWRFGPPGWIGR